MTSANPLFTAGSGRTAAPVRGHHHAHYEEAILAGMAGQRTEIEAIATDPAEPTFDNTVVALERSGALLRRATASFFLVNGRGHDSPEREAINERRRPAAGRPPGRDPPRRPPLGPDPPALGHPGRAGSRHAGVVAAGALHDRVPCGPAPTSSPADRAAAARAERRAGHA